MDFLIGRQFLSPKRSVRYHLKDFNGEGHHPKNADELFNLHHSSLRNVIERIFECRSDEFPIDVVEDQSSDMEDDIFDTNLLSQQQQRVDANAWRTSIVDAMWNDRPTTTTNEEEEESEEE
ncbi:uncharacterized protein LOC141702159 [Apium graveolens]|uniref:uncharacterized protein LOC141702159 n=1 Tax=Apium graveolens TaxID=4045 RepID=UPI003D79A5ED